MKLNHINLTVADVQDANNFLVKYFGMRSMAGNKGMSFLSDEKEHRESIPALFTSAFLSKTKRLSMN